VDIVSSGIMLEQLSSTEENDSEDEVHTPVYYTRKLRRANTQPRTSAFQNLVFTAMKCQRSRLRQQARDDKYAALTCTY
jgi:hypothetical protein